MLVTSSCQKQTVFSIGFPAQPTLNGRSVVVIDKAYLNKQDVKAGCGSNMFDGLFKGIAAIGLIVMGLGMFAVVAAATISVGATTKSYQSTVTTFAVTSVLALVLLGILYKTLDLSNI